MSPLAFFEQLADTPWSMALHESEIAYSIIESVHVWSLVLFFGLVIIFDLRLLGWAFQKVPVSEFSRRLLPWTILRADGDNRHTAGRRDPRQVLSEPVLQVQNDPDAARGH
jgi:hypothetical protein